MNHFKRLSFVSTFIVATLPFILKAEIATLDTGIATLEEVADYQMLDGQIEAVNKSTVSAQTAGVISKLGYDVGDIVKKGSLIARISSQNQKSGVLEAKAGVGQAKASVSGANASISGAVASMNEAKATIARSAAAIAQAKASAKEAQANYAAARSEFDRVKGLYAKRILTKSQFEQAEATMRSSFARVEAAKASQQSAEASRVAALSRLNSAKAALTSSKANLASAKAALSSSKAGLSIKIIGHTDDSGDVKKNWELSSQRAYAVLTHLMQKGLDQSHAEVVAYAFNKPLANTDGLTGLALKEARSKNRRVTIVIGKSVTQSK